VHDLTDAEFGELDELLAATPEPLEPLDAVMLDGYLCGVIVQPVLLEPATWLAHVFDFDGRPLPDAVDARWLERTRSLILRRHAVLNRSLDEDGWFDPLVIEEPLADEPGGDLESAAAAGLGNAAAGEGGSAAAADGEGGDPGGAPADDAADERDESAGQVGLDTVSRALMPWVAGFQHACAAFPDLDEMDDDTVHAALARLYRHLPAETDEERELVETMRREAPLADIDAAVEDMVAAVADLYDVTREIRYKVETVRREAPKVGRNDPCPCGSGKKFKQCHGTA
jgi:uncharacterized protein